VNPDFSQEAQRHRDSRRIASLRASVPLCLL